MNVKQFKKLKVDLEYFLCQELVKSIEPHDPFDIIGKFEMGPYVVRIERLMLLQDEVPHELKAAEAYSYRRRKIILADNYKATRKHDAVYEPDWLVRVVAESVDVTAFNTYSVAEVFKILEEQNFRQRYDKLAKKNFRISDEQFVIEDKVREFCMTSLRTPDKPGFQRNNNKRFKGNDHNKKELQVSNNGRHGKPKPLINQGDVSGIPSADEWGSQAPVLKDSSSELPALLSTGCVGPSHDPNYLDACRPT